MNEQTRHCPCGSGKNYADCCGRWIEDGESPPRAEQLMRSRYCAFVIRNSDYLLRTWHADTRPEQLQLERDVSWFGLEIVASDAGGPGDSDGRVEFIAQFNGHDRLQYLHERSRFVRENGRWFYLDGEILPPPTARKIGRNAPCPCGSGKKYKRCCG